MKVWILFVFMGATGFGIEESGEESWQACLWKDTYNRQPTIDDFMMEAKISCYKNEIKNMWEYLEEAARMGSEDAGMRILHYYGRNIVDTESCFDWNLCASLPEQRQKPINQRNKSRSTPQYNFLDQNYFLKPTPEEMIQKAIESFLQRNYDDVAYYLQQAAQFGSREAKQLMEIYNKIDIRDNERRQQFLQKCLLLLGNDEIKKHIGYRLCSFDPHNLLKRSIYRNVIIKRQ